MELYDPVPYPFDHHSMLAVTLLISAIDDLPRPSRLESTSRTQALGQQIGLLASEVAGYQGKFYAHGCDSITNEDVCEAAISNLRSRGVRVGVFRRHKIFRLVEL